jgi:tRNA (guanosine-2'-O-)-methyltransferase
MNNTQKHDLINYLKQFVTDNKQQLIQKIIQHRTRHLTVVLEDLYQPHNASAVIRSCECFGVQDLHVIENTNRFKINKGVVLGSAKWVTLHRYKHVQNNTRLCLEQLKKQGYKIVATTLRPGSKPLQDLSLSQKTAICFGSEERGLSDDAHELADERVYIPMLGFTQSFNVSVSAAICLALLTDKLHRSDIDWALNEDERTDLTIEWLKKSSTNADKLMKNFLSSQKKK